MSQHIWFIWTIYKLVMKSIIHLTAFGMMVLFLWFYFHHAQVLRLTIYKLYFFSLQSLDSFANKWGRDKILISEFAGKHKSPKQSLKCILQMVLLFFISTWQTAHTCVFVPDYATQSKRYSTHTDFSYTWYRKCSFNMCSDKGRQSGPLTLDAKMRKMLTVEISLWYSYVKSINCDKSTWQKCRTGR